MRNSKRICILGISALLILLGACRSNTVGELPTVKVAINTWPGLGPYYVAKAKGFDKEEGIQLDVIMNEDTVARHSSLAAGEVDLVGITLDSVVTQIMSKEFNVPPDDFKRMAAGAKLADLKAELSTFGTAQTPGPIVQLAKDASELWLKTGAIKKAVDPKDVIDWTVVDELRNTEK